jgi:phosphate-selective porin OprO and OprP
LFLWLTTPDEDFTMHPGMWTQWDNVWFSQSNYLTAPPGARPGHAQGVASGVAKGGIGPLQDGTFFRRIRPYVEGTLWDVFEYRLILAAENDQFSTEGLDEFWVGVNKIPFIGTIRLGHVKTPMGLEGDMTASSRDMTFMERSAYSESIELNQNFATGVWFNNTYLDERVTQQFMIFRPDQGASSGVFFGTGQWGWQGRWTALPLYEEEGRKLLHLGISYGYRSGTNNLANSPYNLVQLRARPELRDDVPDGSASGAQIVPNSNSNRLIDTGNLAANNEYLLLLELLQVWGPFSVQAEYGWNFVNGVSGANPTGLVFASPIKPAQNYMFDGGYVQLAYTLTGEHRAYDKKIGTLARYYYGADGPNTNAWLVRDGSGRLNFGSGAWEVACRYSYVNLNDGVGINRIVGGRLDGFTLGLNWYLNKNMNLMIDWVYNRRSDVGPGVFPGYVNGFGTELQIQF